MNHGSPYDYRESPCEAPNKKGRQTSFNPYRPALLEKPSSYVGWKTSCIFSQLLFAKRDACVYSWPRQLHPEDRKAEKSVYCLPYSGIILVWIPALTHFQTEDHGWTPDAKLVLFPCLIFQDPQKTYEIKTLLLGHLKSWISECPVLYSRLSINKLGNTFAAVLCTLSCVSKSEYPKPFILTMY